MLLGSVFTRQRVDVNPLEAKLSFDQDECHMLKDVEITLEISFYKITTLKENTSPRMDNIAIVGLHRIADFTIRPNKNNSFYYSAEYE